MKTKEVGKRKNKFSVGNVDELKKTKKSHGPTRGKTNVEIVASNPNKIAFIK